MLERLLAEQRVAVARREQRELVPGQRDDVFDEILHPRAMMAACQPVRLDREGDVAEIVLDAPPLNLFDEALFAAVVEAVALARPTLPRGADRARRGQGVHRGRRRPQLRGLDAAGGAELTARYLDVTHRIEALPLPTLAVAHGLCLTAGFELSLACDLLWAARGGAFGLVEKVVGITPLMVDAAGWPSGAGAARARELVMTGGLYTAETLHEWGCGEPRARPRRPARHRAPLRRLGLAAGPTRAHAATKAVVKAQSDHGVAGADAERGASDLTSVRDA